MKEMEIKNHVQMKMVIITIVIVIIIIIKIITIITTTGNEWSGNVKRNFRKSQSPKYFKYWKGQQQEQQ